MPGHVGKSDSDAARPEHVYTIETLPELRALGREHAAANPDALVRAREQIGDDDLFTFINGRLAIDLGGVHGPMESEIDLDARAAELGIEVGEVYSLDFFFAERHLTQSNFRIDTTIGDFVDCGTIPN